MLLLTPSVSGLFKWRQFEPEVILLCGWLVLAVFHCRTVTSRNSLLRSSGFLNFDASFHLLDSICIRMFPTTRPGDRRVGPSASSPLLARLPLHESADV